MLNYRKFLELDRTDLSDYIKKRGNPEAWRKLLSDLPTEGTSQTVSRILEIVSTHNPVYLRGTIIKKPHFHGLIVPAFNIRCNKLIFCSHGSKSVVVLEINEDGSIKRMGVALIRSPGRIEYEISRIIDGFSRIV